MHDSNILFFMALWPTKRVTRAASINVRSEKKRLIIMTEHFIK